jgi:hypothetical protein
MPVGFAKHRHFAFTRKWKQTASGTPEGPIQNFYTDSQQLAEQ